MLDSRLFRAHVPALRGLAGVLVAVSAGAALSTTTACTKADHASPPRDDNGASSLAAPPLEPLPPPSPPSSIQVATAPVTGTVAEIIQVTSNTYVRLATSQGEQWAAVPPAKLAIGDTATILNPTVMESFKSPTLHRSFEHIVFGTLAGQPALPAPSGNPHAGIPIAQVAASATDPASPVPKATGPNAHTIAEVLAEKAHYDGKAVAVRGRVTKYNADIMGKNWLHLVDGSSAGAAAGELVVTTHDTTSVGSIVVVTGVVHTNRDFGSGYSYAVLVEDATVGP